MSYDHLTIFTYYKVLTFVSFNIDCHNKCVENLPFNFVFFHTIFHFSFLKSFECFWQSLKKIFFSSKTFLLHICDTYTYIQFYNTYVQILQITLLVHQIVREIRFTVMSNLKYNTVFGLSDSNNVCSAFSAVYCKTSFPFRFDFRYQCNYR